MTQQQQDEIEIPRKFEDIQNYIKKTCKSIYDLEFYFQRKDYAQLLGKLSYSINNLSDCMYRITSIMQDEEANRRWDELESKLNNR